jgi:hypothetical protein
VEKSTYVYLGFLTFLFVAFGSVNTPYPGLAYFLGELVGTFLTLYLIVLIVSKLRSHKS